VSEETREILTTVVLFGVLMPSACFAAGTIARVFQVMNRYGRQNNTIRRRFQISKLAYLLTCVGLFSCFQGYVYEPQEMRSFIFIASLILLAEGFGFAFLAWDLWWQGLSDEPLWSPPCWPKRGGN
jgi:vacuolar-type H+-ATPase subunit I/STV1